MTQHELNQKEWNRTGIIQVIVNVLLIILAILLFGWTFLGCTPWASAAWFWEKKPQRTYKSAEEMLQKASTLETRKQQLNAKEQRLNAEQQAARQAMQQQDAQYSQAIQQSQQVQDAAKQQALRAVAEKNAMMADNSKYRAQLGSVQLAQQEQQKQARRFGTDGEQQPTYGYAGEDGTMYLAKNEPVNVITKPDGNLGVNKPGMHVTVIQPPAVVTVLPADTRVQTTVDGIDHIEFKAILPESLSQEQLDAVNKIALNGKVIAEQRLGLEQHKINTEAAVEQYAINTESELEYLRIVKGFTLWGFLMSIPFIFTVYYISKQLLIGWSQLVETRLKYKLREIEGVDRVLGEKAP